MKQHCLFIPLLFLFAIVSAQPETILWDGEGGFSGDFEDDTLVIYRVMRGTAASNSGIQKGDKIISVNGTQIAGVGINIMELESCLHNKVGTEMNFNMKREGADSLLSFSFIHEYSLDMDMWTYGYYDYLVDSTNSISVKQLLSDSSGIQFKSVIDNGISVHSLVYDTSTADLDIRPGDKLIGFNSGFDSWATLMFDEYKDSDSIIRISRDSSEFNLHSNLRSVPDLHITSVLEQDLKAETIWLRIIFTKRLAEDKTFLIRFGTEDSIHLFQRRPDGSILEKRTGFAITDGRSDPFYKTSPVLRLNARVNIQDTVFIRLYQDGGITYTPEIDILSYDYSVEFEKKERLLLGAILGIFLIIIFYYLILYIFLKDKSYIIYLLFIISLFFTLLFLSGYGSQFVWPASISFFNSIEVLFITLPITFLLLFESVYLDIKNTLRRWYQLGKISLIGLWIVSLLLLVESFTNKTNLHSDDVFESVLVILIAIFIAALIIISCSTLIIRVRQKYKPARYFLYGLIVLALALLNHTGLIPLTDYLGSLLRLSYDFDGMIGNASIYIGAIIQFLIFSVGLSQKMGDKEQEVKHAQENLIKQLKINEKLKDKQNIELERKVKERTKEILEQKEEIETQRDLMSDQNKEITDSINYARKIQAAVLPTDADLKELLPEHFILFRPRDIVSGDFYWIKQIKNFTVVVAADCTGHGVPGAFMSMLGMSMLNEIVGRSRLDSAGVFLDRLRKKVKSTLSQKGKDMEQKDGMDLSLAILDSDNNEIQYAGAFNPLYIIRSDQSSKKSELSDFLSMEKGGKQLYEIKGDRQPISIYSREKAFKTHYIKLHSDDSLYMFSDGYPDQMGGERGKKFMVKKFKELLLSVQEKDMQSQKKILDDTLVEWMNDVKQIDDILVFGIKWK